MVSPLVYDVLMCCVWDVCLCLFLYLYLLLLCAMVVVSGFVVMHHNCCVFYVVFVCVGVVCFVMCVVCG